MTVGPSPQLRRLAGTSNVGSAPVDYCGWLGQGGSDVPTLTDCGACTLEIKTDSGPVRRVYVEVIIRCLKRRCGVLHLSKDFGAIRP